MLDDIILNKDACNKKCLYCGSRFNLLDTKHEMFGLQYFKDLIDKDASDSEKAKSASYYYYYILENVCSACDGKMIWLLKTANTGSLTSLRCGDIISLHLKYISKDLSKHVDKKFMKEFKPFENEFNEAYKTLESSPTLSAVGSRTCLESVLRKKAGVKYKNLYEEIGEVVKSGSINRLLESKMDIIRRQANVAAHPEIEKVSLKDAIFLLEVLEDILMFYFVEKPKTEEYIKKFNIEPRI